MKRYLVYPIQFDSRAHMLDEVGEHWDEQVKQLHLQNREKLIAALKMELGEYNFDMKLQNFKDLGFSPFSIVAHHNALFHQARYAFIHGYYYPALTSACALGERILNHLFLDLRGSFPQSTIDKRSHTRDSIDKWPIAVRTLDEWKVFTHPDVGPTFEKLKEVRNRSLHFNADTVKTLREDALKALGCLATIIEKQFGFQTGRTIPGTAGAFFLRREAEAEPFIRYYYLQQSPYVSPYFAMSTHEGHWLVFDKKFDPDVEISDADFVEIFNKRGLDEMAPTTVPWTDVVEVVAMTSAGVMEVEYRAPSDPVSPD